MYEIVTGLPPYSSAKKMDLVCSLLVGGLVFQETELLSRFCTGKIWKGKVKILPF